MNNSYNYSDFVELMKTSDHESSIYGHEKTLLQPVTNTHKRRDETIDSILFSSALADIYYTD
ncbi:MAG: hypothetical protein OEY87_06950 [Gammaproteobacteria bacterium]|nr:hypothetical protein [Gammaproteobacteria bacterium]MDH5735843.1 hypothetical protein [Gammaproteobacteria bacterium]